MKPQSTPLAQARLDVFYEELVASLAKAHHLAPEATGLAIMGFITALLGIGESEKSDAEIHLYLKRCLDTAINWIDAVSIQEKDGN